MLHVLLTYYLFHPVQIQSVEIRDMKEEETFGGTETLTRVCGETEGLRDGVQSRWNKPTALCVYRNTIFVCHTGNKAVRNVDVSKWTDPPAK